MQEKENLIAKLNKINATIGKYAIKGEEDNTTFNEIFTNSNFEILDNSIENVYIDNSYIQIIAIDESSQSYATLKEQNTSAFTIAITHMPDNSDNIINTFNPNLILAGHSHNGQVRLPFIEALMKKEGAQKYTDSYYKINDTELLISGGIGNSKYNIRLFNHPSINFIRLRTISE